MEAYWFLLPSPPYTCDTVA